MPMARSGVGTSPSLTMELVKQKTGVDLTFICYRGASAAAADVLAARCRWCIANINSLMGQVNAGKLKPIASTGAQRSGAAPNTPTFVEAGFPDLDRHLVVALGGAGQDAGGNQGEAQARAPRGPCKQPDVIESMKVGGFDPGTMSVAEADAFIKAEYQRWGEVIRAAGIKPQ